MTVEEMTDTLSRLGIEIESTRGDEIQAHCPAHLERTGKTDRNPSWWINADSGAHNCFSCGWKGNLYSLISYVTGAEYEKASAWLGSAEALTARYERLFEEKKPIQDVTHITESMLHAFTEPPAEALAARGLTSSAASKYEIKWEARNNNWIIPIRDAHDGSLMGWQEKGYDRRYFNNRPAGIKKSETLFGYLQSSGTGPLIVVESPLDVVRLSSVGVDNAVAVFGAKVSHAQFNIIRGADRIIFAMDNDEAGRVSSESLLYMSKEMGVECWFFHYGDIDVKDVGAMSKTEIVDGINKATHMIRGIK